MTRCEICRSPIDADRKVCDRCAAKYAGLATDQPAPEKPATRQDPVKQQVTEKSSLTNPDVIFPDSRYAADRASQPGSPPRVVPKIVRPVGGGAGSRPVAESSKGLVVDPRRSAIKLDEDPAGDLSGTVLEGKYELLEELGRGSMGTVYLASDITLKRKVAVKFLLPEMISAAESSERFRREAVAMAAIHDQNVAQIFTYGERGNRPYFVMEYLPGDTVESLIDSHNDKGSFVPLAEALDVLWQVVGGLGEIHNSGAVHRDIKPANIVITGDPKRAVILDFGLARDVRLEDDMMTLAGTPAYIAPELVQGVEGADVSPLVDIYSTGATAYELITGSIPFTGESWLEILDKHVHSDPLRPSERRPDLPPLLDEILLTAMAKNPSDRYPTAEDFLKSLMLIDGDTALVSTPPARPDGYSKPLARHTPTNLRRRSHTPIGLTRSSVAVPEQRSVLVLDGDPEFRGLVSGTAGAAISGCRVLAAADSGAAIEMLAEATPQIALIDVSLPDIVGMEVAAVIQADDKYRGVSIVGVASADSAPDDEALSWLNLAHFVTKPIDVGQLADLLRSLCEGPSQPG